MHWKRAMTKRGMLALNENLSRIKTMMKITIMLILKITKMKILMMMMLKGFDEDDANFDGDVDLKLSKIVKI